ncbi:tryptophan synthase subunit alpha [Bacillus sp. REN10]|uniref:tryptophan synthase subunit alpha n=1 Tax=Bacillus sp. REN10 TaxID=2782541 RepID=UPI00193B8F89|nr:tryptophan synthase subunit alpha [Bacillus sp. REN10]
MSKEKIKLAFQTRNEKNKKAFVAYIMAGDGGLNKLKDQMLYLQQIGVTLIEVGIPFSDPVADGPVIQEAGKRALQQKVTLKKVLDELRNIKNDLHIPFVLMTYFNPVYRYGVEQVAHDAASAGVSGVIIPDVPLEEEEEVKSSLDQHDLALIRLVTLTSPIERIKRITEGAEGFIYAVTIKGITGVRSNFQEEVYQFLQRIKAEAKVPVLAGFGVSSREQAQELGQHCDGVIVGSQIVQLFHEGKQEEIAKLLPEPVLHAHE